jgi:hypothetical protein
MISISLNQTESEKRLNRILYYVKVLRAEILNLLLIFLAIALYIAFGITGVYPTEEGQSTPFAHTWISPTDTHTSC